jgi:hypothetical protein
MSDWHRRCDPLVWRGAAAGAAAAVVGLVAGGGLLLGTAGPLVDLSDLGPVPAMVLAVVLAGVLGVAVCSLAGAGMGAAVAALRQSRPSGASLSRRPTWKATS